MKIILSEEELDKAKWVSAGRNAQNEGGKDKPYYHRDLMQSDDVAGVASAAAECAVAKAVNRHWHAKVWPRDEHWRHVDEPDVGDNIEVRRIRESGNGLVVRKKDLHKGKVIFVAYPDPLTGFKEVEVIGWLKADDAWEIGEDYLEDTKRVPQRLLRREGL
jgi:hypothetical protein